MLELIILAFIAITVLSVKNFIDNRKLHDQILVFKRKLARIESNISQLSPSEEQASEVSAPMEKTEDIQKSKKTEPPQPIVSMPKQNHIPSTPGTEAEPAADQPSEFGDGIGTIEKDLSTRWMVWLGGLAFALGSAFMVKYSIDAGLMKPVVRVTIGAVLGIVMTATGELLRQRRLQVPLLHSAPDYVPSAIAAAGLFTAFAAVYSAYALYQLIPALVAFGALAVFSFVASGLALVHGRFFAILGMVGGLLIPALISTGSGNAWALFPYLLVIVGTNLWVSRQRAWLEVALPTLGLATLWVVVWIFTNWKSSDIIPIGLYLIILSGLNSAMARGASPDRTTAPSVRGLFPKHMITVLSDLVALLCVLFLVSAVRLDHYSAVGLTLITIHLIGQAYAVYKSPENDMGGLFAIVGILFLLGSWHVPDLFEIQKTISGPNYQQFAWSPIAPPGLEKFIIACLLYGTAVGTALFFALPKVLRAPLWASLGVLTPVSALVIAYWRIKDLETSLPFAMVALALCVIFALATGTVRKRKIKDVQPPTAAYAAGTTMALALAFTMLLRDAWLSFALALEIVALAYIWQKTLVRGLRYLALILATVVLARLFLNASIFHYASDGPMPIVNWLFYGYGLTSILFAIACRLFDEHTPGDKLISVLKAGAIMLLISFITLEIRVVFSESNRLTSDPTDFEVALQTLNWSAATLVLFWREIRDGDIIFKYLRRTMTFVSLSGLVIGGGLTNNVFFGEAVGPLPIFNLQFLQFFLPALLYGGKAYLAHTDGREASMKLYGVVAFLAIWFWLSAEVFHLFHPDATRLPVSDWEKYSYSLVWLLYAIGLLTLGLRLRVSQIRLAGFGVLSIVVLKVFLVDMSTLEGLARALSFMGLGVALIGIGYLYQRLKPNPGPS